ncbi:glycerophosphoryl diester phosphodiesterase [Lachnospiraceae bacterium KM106-2]|nr:glycerophosphoryl diester phosphodiesterase [Lachnospiraceae bacterium KM106-2]
MGFEIWGHRGASAYETENTLEAFELAIHQGADGIELDVQLTKDNQLVVFHDETLLRVAKREGYIKDYTLQELKQIRLPLKQGEGSTTIPTLREVYELVKPYQLKINVELKTSIFPYEGIEKLVLQETKEMGLEDRVIYSSFNHHTLLRLKEFNSLVKTGMLCSDVIVDLKSYVKKIQVDAIHPIGFQLLMPEVAEDMKQAMIDINVWTVNKSEDMINLWNMQQVTSIITNYPDIAIKVREELER